MRVAMMTIETLLKQPEGKTLEFKRDLSSPKKLMKTLVAFDELPMPELGLEDLDLSALKSMFRGSHELDEKELLTLRLLKKDQGRLVPTKGAVLLCG
jgi:predicted HTH transcriptional regulator